MGTFSERFIRQGMEQGREQGERLGVRKGEAKVLLTLLQLKFGEVPATAGTAIDAADADTWLRWSQRVLTATCIEDVIADPV